MAITNRSRLLENKDIAIVGAGPGGLTLARLLQIKGANVKVYERDLNREVRVQGAIVDLHFHSGLKVLEAAGLMPAFKVNYMRGANKLRIVDKYANICVDENSHAADDDFSNEHFKPEIDRGSLRNILIDSLLLGTVVWDSQFVSMLQVNNAWEIQFKNGTGATADIVIGSDGYRSKIRPYVTDIKTLYSGAAIIQGEIDNPEKECPEMYALANNANLFAMGVGKTIAAQPRGDAGLSFYTASLYPENWEETSAVDFNNRKEVLAFLAQFYEGWHPIFFTLFKASKQFMFRPLSYFPLDQHWDAKANITILGDAAHLMPPSGEGVNLAMLDSLDLCQCLVSDEFKNIQDGIAAYEKQMRSRAARLGQEAVEGMTGLASPSEESIKSFIQQFDSAR